MQLRSAAIKPGFYWSVSMLQTTAPTSCELSPKEKFFVFCLTSPVSDKWRQYLEESESYQRGESIVCIQICDEQDNT